MADIVLYMIGIDVSLTPAVTVGETEGAMDSTSVFDDVTALGRWAVRKQFVSGAYL